MKVRALAHRKGKDALKKLAPLKEGDPIEFFALIGSSGNGADPMRRTQLRVQWDVKKRVLRTTVVWLEYTARGAVLGTSDMRYVGFKAVVGKLARGTYTWEHYEIKRMQPSPYQRKPSTDGKPRLIQKSTFEIAGPK